MRDSYTEIRSSEARKVLAAVVNGVRAFEANAQKSPRHGKWLQFKEIRYWTSPEKERERLADPQIKRGLEELLSIGLVTAKGKARSRERLYGLQYRLRDVALRIGHKETDKRILDSYPQENIIGLVASRRHTSVYGLKADVFRKSVDGTINLEVSKKETRDFNSGIRASELMGVYYGTSHALETKLRQQASALKRPLTENEILDIQTQYYMELVKTGQAPENIIRYIINSHRREIQKFETIGANILSKLLELKKAHRRGELEGAFDLHLKESTVSKRTKGVLRVWKNRFLDILNKDDVGLTEETLENTLFEWHGGTFGLLAANPFEKSIVKFGKAIDLLTLNEKREVVLFLMGVVRANNLLYPTHVTFLARSFGGIVLSDDLPVSDVPKSTWNTV